MKRIFFLLFLFVPTMLVGQVITVKDRETGQTLELVRIFSASPKP